MSNLIKTPPVMSGELQLSPIQVNEDYANKWNENSTDFVCLSRNGEPIRETLYRIGGIESIRPNQPITKDYILILKYVEAFYEDFISKDIKGKRHLDGLWCIIDKNGVEKKVFDKYKHPYLCGGIIYTYDNHYYNIETGQCYGKAYSSIKSENYIFLENAYVDESKQGVLKINKKDGTTEFFK